MQIKADTVKYKIKELKENDYIEGIDSEKIDFGKYQGQVKNNHAARKMDSNSVLSQKISCLSIVKQRNNLFDYIHVKHLANCWDTLFV